LDRKTAESLFNRIPGIRCLVVGDLMLDEYLWGKTDRISPEAPVQVVDVIRDELRPGGAGNVAQNLLELGATVSLCSAIGDDSDGHELLSLFKKKNISTDAVFKDSLRRTSRKTRVVASNQQIVRIDRESREPLSPGIENNLCLWLADNVGKFDIVLLSDYLKGILTDRVISTTASVAAESGIPVIADPKGRDFTRYRGVTLLTPNLKEAEQASGLTIENEESLAHAAMAIMTSAGLPYLLLTRGEAGMSLFSADGRMLHIPAIAREVFDVSGAGDTVLAFMAAGMASGLDIAEAARISNIAAGIAVGKLGTSVVYPDEMIDSISRSHSDSDSKIKNHDTLSRLLEREKTLGKSIVFTNGCFDLLHAGHVKYLQKARKLGDILVLGLNSDDSVRRLKGEKRPLIREEERAHILAALDCVDFVVLFDEDTPIELIRQFKPDILAKGGDYAPESVVGGDIVESYGGRIEIVSFVDGKSTTNIIEQVLERYS